MKKRILITILSIVMLVGLMPITAFAATDPSVLVGGVEMYSASGATYYADTARFILKSHDVTPLSEFSLTLPHQNSVFLRPKSFPVLHRFSIKSRS